MLDLNNVAMARLCIKTADELLNMLSYYDYNDEDFIKKFKEEYMWLEDYIKTPSNIYNLFVDNFLYGNYDKESHKRELIIKDILEVKKELAKTYLLFAEEREEIEEFREYNRNKSKYPHPFGDY